MNTNKSKLPNLPSGKTTSSGDKEMRNVPRCAVNKVIEYAFKTTLSIMIMLGLSSSIYAAAVGDTTAGATILNVAVVEWTDGSGTTTYTDSFSVSVTVDLVPTAATVSGLPINLDTGDGPLTSAPLGILTGLTSGETATYYYAITSNANGEDTYIFSDDVAFDSDNYVYSGTGAGIDVDLLSSAGVASDLFEDNAGNGSIDNGTTSIQLASGIVLAATPDGSNLTVELPGGSLHGFETGDLVVLLNEVFEVTGTVVDGSADSYNDTSNSINQGANSTLTLTAYQDTTNFPTTVSQATNPSDLVATAPGAILRQIIFLQVQVTGSTIDNDNSADLTYDYSFTDSEGNESSNLSNQTVWTPLQLAITKFVRNATQTAMTGNGAQVNLLGHPTATTPSFYERDITADPGDVLEYLIIVDNDGTGGDASAVKITDAVPQFTDLYSAVSYAASIGTGLPTEIFALLSADLDFSTSVVSVDIAVNGANNLVLGGGSAPSGIDENSPILFDVGANATTVGGGGTLIDNATVHIIYQVVVE